MKSKTTTKTKALTHWTIKAQSGKDKFHMGCTHVIPNKKFLQDIVDPMPTLTLDDERIKGILGELKTKRKATFGDSYVTVTIKEEKVKVKKAQLK